MDGQTTNGCASEPQLTEKERPTLKKKAVVTTRSVRGKMTSSLTSKFKGRDKAKAKAYNDSARHRDSKDVKGKKKSQILQRSKKGRAEGLKSKLQAVSIDPLNLAALIDKGGSESPQNDSPIVEHAHDFDLNAIIPTDMSDPLQLNPNNDNGATRTTPKKKKKRKRRHTFHGGTEAGTEEGTELRPLIKRERLMSASDQDDNIQPVQRISQSSEDNDDNDGLKDEQISDDATTPGSTKELKEDGNSGDNLELIENNEKHTELKIPEKTPVKDRMETKQMTESNKKQTVENKPNTSTQVNKNFREKDRKFRYGNYNRYYGYRNPNMAEDTRLALIQRDWIVGKDCLDIGCNVGHVTLWIARHMHPNAIVGIDIDAGLVKAAQNNIRHYLPTEVPSAPCQSEFPISFALCQGPLAAPVCMSNKKAHYGFPYNVSFHEENYVPGSDEELKKVEAKFDTIICLSLTKWVHLNWGDDGLKRMFKKIFTHLKPGGKLILEPQPFKSYKKKKNLTPETRANFDKIKFQPDKFIPFLLSKEVGFATSEVLDTPRHKVEGFRRPLYVLTKSEASGTLSSKEIV